MQYGKLFERALVGELLQQGFVIPRNTAELDYDAKLDFVITRFPGNLIHHSVGVQITVGEFNNVPKMQTFLSVHSGKYKEGVQRCLFIQADKDLDLAGGGASVIGAALTQFQFSRDMVKTRLMGLDVSIDLSYEFFLIDERITEFAKQKKEAAHAQAESATKPASGQLSPARVKTENSGTGFRNILEGEITFWDPVGGFGYIAGQDNATYYLHVNSVSSDQLRGLLQVVGEKTRYPIKETVEFEPGEKVKSTYSHRPAKNVRIALGNKSAEVTN